MSGLNIPRKVPTPEQAFDNMMGGPPVKPETEEIPLSNLIPYEGQPFQPYSEEKLQDLAESIQLHGLLTPIIVRKLGMDLYQILAGHNRVAALKLLGRTTAKAVVKTADDDEAALIMLDTNLQQRLEFLPSELARAYKMQLDTLKRKSGRPQNNVSQIETRSRSDTELAQSVGKSRAQIHRYISLNNLIPNLLALTDQKELPLNAAVSLSHLTSSEQKRIYDVLELKGVQISIAQAAELQRRHKEKEEAGQQLLFEDIEAVLCPQKAAGIRRKDIAVKPITLKVQIPQDRFSEYFPDMKPKEAAAQIEQIIQEWLKKKEATNEGTMEENAG